MKKQEYEECNKPTFYCTQCNTERAKELFSYRNVNKSGVGHCNICDWIKRHKGIPIYDRFTKSEMYHIIEYMFTNETTIVNDLSNEMNKSIEEIVQAIRFAKIGNKKTVIRYNCECCGKEKYTNVQKYFDNANLYCSPQCYYKDKTNKVEHGEDSMWYNRIVRQCTNCGKEMKLIPSRANQKNIFGDSHVFCCNQCYWEYRKVYYKGDKHIGFELTETIRDKMKRSLAKRLCNENRLDTKIQISVNSMLDCCNIKYKREYPLMYYSIDNYLLDYNLMIEVQGDYWHCNPTRYNSNKYLINIKQYEWIHRDKIKHSYIKNNYNTEILYLWESDINKRADVCQALILLYINNNGVLSNYHSFNYILHNGTLELNEDLIIPYQDMPCKDYKHLVKNPA